MTNFGRSLLVGLRTRYYPSTKLLFIFEMELEKSAYDYFIECSSDILFIRSSYFQWTKTASVEA